MTACASGPGPAPSTLTHPHAHTWRGIAAIGGSSPNCKAIVANTCEKAAHVLCKAARVGLSSYDGLLWTKAGARGVHGFEEDFGVAVQRGRYGR